MNFIIPFVIEMLIITAEDTTGVKLLIVLLFNKLFS